MFATLSTLIAFIGLAPVTAIVTTHPGDLDSLAKITTDTGAYAPGNHNFARFTLPGECVAAAQQASLVVRRPLQVQYHVAALRDTAPELDTLPPSAIAIARACGTHFTVDQTASTDLPSLFTLALLMGNDHMAYAVVQRQLALAGDATTRQTVLVNAVAEYVAAEPARFELAERTTALADSLALVDHVSSLPVHVPLLGAVQNTFDRPWIVKEARRIIELGHQLAFDAIGYNYWPLIQAWKSLLEVAFIDHPDSVLAIAQDTKADLSRFPVRSMRQIDFKRATVLDVRDSLLPFNPDLYQDSHTLPPVTASYWFPEQPANWPPTGHVSLVLYGGWVMSCARGDAVLGWLNRQTCEPWHTYLRTWTEQYTTQGFSLVVVERTHGYAVRSNPLTQRAEADSLNWYYRHYLHLPATLAVVATQMKAQLPEPDGRRWFSDTTAFGQMLSQNASVYRELTAGSPGIALLFDREGKLLYAGVFNRSLVHAMIVRALGIRTRTRASASVSSPTS